MRGEVDPRPLRRRHPVCVVFDRAQLWLRSVGADGPRAAAAGLALMARSRRGPVDPVQRADRRGPPPIRNCARHSR
jgi:hypothetical protein